MALKRPRKTRLEFASSSTLASTAAVKSPQLGIEIHPACRSSCAEALQQTDGSSPCTNPIAYLYAEECATVQDPLHGADNSGIANNSVTNKSSAISDSNDNDDALQPPPKKKKKHYNQKFRENWKMDAELKDWLQRDPKNPSQAYCVVCDEHLRGSIHHMKRHSRTRSHQKKSLQSKTVTDSSKLVTECSFVVEHNDSFALMDHLPQIIQELCPDSSVVHHLQCMTSEGKDLADNINVNILTLWESEIWLTFDGLRTCDECNKSIREIIYKNTTTLVSIFCSNAIPSHLILDK